MTQNEYAHFCVALDRFYTSNQPHTQEVADTIHMADKLIYHSRRIASIQDEAGIERIIRKVENLTNLEWDAITENGTTRLVGPLEIPS